MQQTIHFWEEEEVRRFILYLCFRFDFNFLSVDGYIHEAAGEDLRNECQTLNGCDEGFSKLTYGYKLPAKRKLFLVRYLVRSIVLDFI